MTQISLTQITAHDCDLTKVFSLNENGQLTTSTIAHMASGRAQMFEIDHVGQLAMLLPLLQRNQAVTCGTPYVGNTELTTRAKTSFKPDAVARTNETFVFPSGATLFPIDVDIDDQHAPYASIQNALDALEAVHPWLTKLHRVARPSASSFVGQRGLRGVHVYFAVTAGADVQTLAERIQVEQWLKNKGWIKISKSGATLIRQISDATIYQPSRLMFEAPPILTGIDRPIPEDQIFVERAADCTVGRPVKFSIDGRLNVNDLPALREIDLRRFETMKRDAKRMHAPRAKAVALNYQKENAIANGFDKAEQERIGLMSIRALHDEKLPTDWRIFVKKLGPVTVGQILQEGDAALGHHCADPFDSYRVDLTDNHCTKAEIVKMNGVTGVWSHKLQRFYAFTTETLANITTPLQQAAEKLCDAIDYPEPRSNSRPSERNLTVALRALLKEIDCLPCIDATNDRMLTSDAMPPHTAIQDAASHIGCTGVSVTMIKEVIKNVSRETIIDPWRDAVLALPVWDGVPRLDTFFFDVMGALPSPALTLTTQLLFAGIVARQINPGAQCPVVPVLIGAHGDGKSFFVRQLATSMGFPHPAAVSFGDSIKMCQMACVSPIAELAEMSGMSKRDIEEIKTWVTDTEDVYRAPYAEYAKRHPRRFVCIGTANKNELNRDETGNRRFMPVLINKPIDYAWRVEATQIYAEARERFCRDESIYFKLVNDCVRAVREFNADAMLRGEGTPISDLDDLMPQILKRIIKQTGNRRIASAEIRAKIDMIPSGRLIRAQHYAAWLKLRGWAHVKYCGLMFYDAPDDFDSEETVDKTNTNVLLFNQNLLTR